MPIHTKTVEWALIEIVILLTGIKDNLNQLTPISDSLKRIADRP